MTKQPAIKSNWPHDTAEMQHMIAQSQEEIAYEFPVRIEGLVADINAGPNQFRLTCNLRPLNMELVYEMLLQAGIKKNSRDLDELMEEIGNIIRKRQLINLLAERMEIL